MSKILYIITSIIMTSITWAGPRCVQELATFLGPQNRTQGRCGIRYLPKCTYVDIRYVFLAQKGIPKLAQENKESKEKIVVPIESNSRTGGMINIETKFSPIDPKLVSRN